MTVDEIRSALLFQAAEITAHALDEKTYDKLPLVTTALGFACGALKSLDSSFDTDEFMKDAFTIMGPAYLAADDATGGTWMAEQEALHSSDS